jgi:hypothetical protein
MTATAERPLAREVLSGVAGVAELRSAPLVLESVWERVE